MKKDKPEKLDSLKNKSSHGGRRKNAGRKAGVKNKKTIEKEMAREQLEQRVLQGIIPLVNSQFDLAKGEKFLMHTKTIGEGTKARKETIMVTNPEIITQYLNGELDESDGDFYYITTKPANNQAIQGLLDRVLGKAAMNMNVEGEQKIIIETRRGRG